VELYQAEWCPHSHAVRQRLTEDEILEYLTRFDPAPDADAHREKAHEEVPLFAEVRSAKS